MQYGNCRKYKKGWVMTIKFKSYYVVWKLMYDIYDAGDMHNV